MSQVSFFDIEKQLDKIYGINGFLRRLNELIDWTIFLGLLNQLRSSSSGSKTGHPPFDLLLMFKILILKNIYNLSDDQLELQIRDRLSFRDFLGISISDAIPDSKTIWLFDEQLTRLGLSEKLFNQFNEELLKRGVTMKSGIIVDSTFVDTPKQHFHENKYEKMKHGEKPESRMELFEPNFNFK